MAPRIYNYLTRKQKRIRPINREQFSMYICEPTVYDHSHLSHAKTCLAMDILTNTLVAQQKGNLVENLVEIPLAIRQAFHAENNWQKADEIRDRLHNTGNAIEDDSDSTSWRLQ